MSGKLQFVASPQDGGVIEKRFNDKLKLNRTYDQSASQLANQAVQTIACV